MSRSGKIARLPRHLREQVNRRLDDGEPGPQLLAWLNECPEAQLVVQRDFGGRSINEQNLSDWRQGGFRDWQRQQEACDHVTRLIDHAAAFDAAADETCLSDRLGLVLAVELFKLLEQLLEQSTDPKEKLGYLRDVLREVRHLRRGDHNASRLQLQLERWEHQLAKEHEAELERMKAESQSRLTDLVLSKVTNPIVAEAFGGGESGRRIAELLHRIKYDLSLDEAEKTSQTEMRSPGSVEVAAGGPVGGNGLTKPNQGKSNQIKPSGDTPERP